MVFRRTTVVRLVIPVHAFVAAIARDRRPGQKHMPEVLTVLAEIRDRRIVWICSNGEPGMVYIWCLRLFRTLLPQPLR